MNFSGTYLWHLWLRILHLDSDAATYVGEIKKSEVFDAYFYKAQRPRNIWAQLFPIRHYVLWGEKQGLWPNPSFSPGSYIKNEHLLDQKIEKPFQHYLRYGMALNLRACPPPVDPTTLPADLETLPIINSPASTVATPRMAVVVHVFYYDTWAEIADALSVLGEPFDLYCTVIKRAGFDRLATDIHNRFPDAQVLCYPNHGRDIFPFVHLVNSGILSKYEAICKLHTKKSTHLDSGDEWRKKLIHGLLPGKAATKALMDTFLNQQDIGAWVADKQLLKHRHYWGPNRERVEQELARIGINANRYRLKFPGGSMFWIKPTALHWLKSMNYKALDFEREEGQLDGTLAHAIERIIGFLVQHSGQKLVERADLLGAKSSANS